MLQRLRLRNFKTWADTGDITLAPVNLFLGSNSTGKSSLLQALLLLKQTVASPDRTVQLNLGGAESGDFVNLGSFDDVLNADARDRMFAIEADFCHRQRGGEPVLFHFAAEYRSSTRGVPIIQSLTLGQDQQYFRAIRRERGAYSVFGPDSSSQPLGKSREFEPERSVAFSPEAVQILGSGGRMVQDISLAIRRELEQIVYLGPLRPKPQRDYTWNQAAPGTIGETGANAIPALLASAQSRNGDGLVESVSSWLKRMGIADRLRVQRLGRSTRYAVIVERDGVSANLRDVGIGISQVLPALTLAYFAPPGATVIMEEPEIHLHPLAQAVLAELFVEVSKEREIQFLVETHSEHLFRRLQTLMAREQLSNEECRPYFVERDGAVARLRTLEVDKFGKVGNWPEKFFGDAVGEAREQALAMAGRLRKEAG